MQSFSLLSLGLCALISEQVSAWSTSPSSGLKLPVHRPKQPTQRRSNGLQRRSSGAYDTVADFDQFWGGFFVNASVGGQPQQLYLATLYSDTQVFASNHLGICDLGLDQCDHGLYNYTASSTFSNLTTFPPVDLSEGNQTLAGYYFNDTLTVSGLTLDNFTMALITNDNASWSLPFLGLGPPQAESYSYTEGTSYTYAPFLTALKSSGAISSQSFSIWIDPTQVIHPDSPTAPQYESGHLLLGAVDESAYQGSLQVYPIVTNVYDARVDVLLVNLYSVRGWIGTSQATTESTPTAIQATIAYDDTYTYLPPTMLKPLYAFYNVTVNETNGPIVDCGLDNPNLTAGYINIDFDFAGPDNGDVGAAAGQGLRIPISAFLSPVYLSNASTEVMKFANGSSVCYFAIDSSGDEYAASIGATLLRYLYVAVDYDSAQIGLALTGSSGGISGGNESSSSAFVLGPTTTASVAVGSGATTGAPLSNTVLLPGSSSSVMVSTVQVTRSEVAPTHTRMTTQRVTVTATPTGAAAGRAGGGLGGAGSVVLLVAALLVGVGFGVGLLG